MSEMRIVIVGAGPIGSALSLAIAQISNAIEVILIDRQPAKETDQNALTPDIPAPCDRDTRVFAVNAATKALLTSIGVWSRLPETRVCAYQSMSVWDAQGTERVDFSCEDVQQPQLGHMLESNLLQAALDQAISEHTNIRPLRPANICALQYDNDQIVLEFDDAPPLPTDLLCGADGAGSRIRELLDITYTEQNCLQSALVANVLLEASHQHCAWQIFRSTGPLAFLPLASTDSRLCSIVWSLDQEQVGRVTQLNTPDFLSELTWAIESRFGTIELASDISAFPLYQRHAQTYLAPRAVLLGDAAHSIHPLAGLGANIGFKDVSSLASEIKRATERDIAPGDATVLRRYERTRKLDNELVLQGMRFFKQFYGTENIYLGSLRNMGMALFNRQAEIKKWAIKAAFMS